MLPTLRFKSSLHDVFFLNRTRLCYRSFFQNCHEKNTKRDKKRNLSIGNNQSHLKSEDYGSHR